VHAHGSAAGYADFAAAFMRPHMRGFAMALFPIFAQGAASPPDDLLAALRGGFNRSMQHTGRNGRGV
jgi:hypothetical protein